MADPQQQKLVKVDEHIIAFPGTLSDEHVSKAIKSFRDKKKQGITHTRATDPHFAPIATEQSEHARQLNPAQSLHTVIDPIDQALAPSAAPTTKTEAALYPVKEGIKGTAAMALAPLTHPLDTVSALWNQVKDALPAYANTKYGILPVPNVEGEQHEQAQAQDILKHPEYNIAPFLIPALWDHGVEAAPIKEKPARFNTRILASNPMGEVRMGTDNIPTVWMHPKGWNAWMTNYDPAFRGIDIDGMNLAANPALRKMIDKPNTNPDWVHTKELMDKAHAAAGQQGTYVAAPKRGEGLQQAIRVLREEKNHSWQRSLVQNRWLTNHLPIDAFNKLNTQIPKAMQAHLIAQGYDGSSPVRVSEAAAKLIGGDYQGSTPEQTASFLSQYFDEVIKQHGPQALDTLEHARGIAAKLKEAIDGEHEGAKRGATQGDVRGVPQGRQGSTSQAHPVQASGAAGTQTVEPAFNRKGPSPTLEDLKREAEGRKPKSRAWRFHNPEIIEGAKEMQAQSGRRFIKRPFVKPDIRAKEIADAYTAMKHDPANPRVKASYDAMKGDIQRQWDYAKDKLGIKFEPWTQDGQPYQNSYEMMKDVRDNKHIYFFQGGDMPVDHPLGAVNPQNGLTYNDMLRVVHDLFGHAMEGYQFGGQGEENAWLAHSQMFSPDALPALTTETRGQNSWVNYGPHMRDAEGNVIQQHQQGFIPANQRPYADQKAGLLPDRFHFRTDSPILFMSPNLFNLDMDSAAIRLGSPTHKTFTRLSSDLSQALGLNSHITSAIGHWEGGAENSVVQKFPMGTDPDTVIYHGSILARATRQNYFGMFNEEEGGPARLYAFWVDGSKGDAKQIASILDKKRISGSTIEPAEDGHTVFLVSDSEHIKPKIDALKKELGVANVEEYAGRREFIGNKDRDRAERDYTSKIEEIESRHPEWRRIREGIESRPDYGHLHGLSRLAENELGEGVPQSYLDHEGTIRMESEKDDAFKRSNKDEISTEGWFTSDGRFVPVSSPGKHKQTAIKHGLGQNYEQAWQNGHIRISKFGPNHWGLESGQNNSTTRGRLLEAIDKLPENAWKIAVESQGYDDGEGTWHTFTGQSAKIEAQDWIDKGMRKDYERGSFRREKRPDSGNGTEENVGAALTSVSILLAEARHRNPSKKENQVVTVP